MKKTKKTLLKRSSKIIFQIMFKSLKGGRDACRSLCQMPDCAGRE